MPIAAPSPATSAPTSRTRRPHLLSPSLTYTYTYIHIYIYKEVHPPPHRSITLKPFLRDGDVTAHPLEDGALHTL
ncbi:hypothetical protein HanRHA438_Chr13g0624341 [Helianthus annuus]|nr:hypothetical protein HanRHA438_Chr13g0624341 [Helianthus annuus]